MFTGIWGLSPLSLPRGGLTYGAIREQCRPDGQREAMSDVETNPDKLYDAATKIRESGDLAGAVAKGLGRVEVPTGGPDVVVASAGFLARSLVDDGDAVYVSVFVLVVGGEVEASSIGCFDLSLIHISEPTRPY